MSGDLALVTAGIFGLMVIDFSDPSNPKLIGSADTPGSFEGVAVSGNLALVTEFLGGLLRVIDIADPTNPREIGFLDTSDVVWAVEVSGDLALVANGFERVLLVDISDPTRPKEVGVIITPGFARGVAVVGDLVLVADGSGGLAIMRFRVGVRGDANGDGLVNGADLLLIAGSLGTSDPRADLNGNGIVDSVDLAQVGINYRR